MKSLLTIGEMAERAGVPVKTIRYYDEVDLLKPQDVTAAGYRLYGDAQLWRLGLIRTLRETGFSVKDIRQLLAGETNPDEAIALQLELLGKQQEKLAQAQAVLRRAQGENALEQLQTLSATLKLTSNERRLFLRDKMRDLLARKAPPEWREGFMADFFNNLPETFSAAQVEAWVDLVKLLEDKEVQTEYDAQMAEFWRTVKEHDFDPQAWQEGLSRSLDQALAALEKGQGPDGSLVQAGVKLWVELYADTLGRQADDAFYEWFARLAPTFVSETGWRLQELVATLSQGDTASVEAQRLLLRGLEHRVAKLPQRQR